MSLALAARAHVHDDPGGVLSSRASRARPRRIVLRPPGVPSGASVTEGPDQHGSAPQAPSVAPSDDLRLVGALRAGDEAAFASLVDGWGPAMLRVALLHVPTRTVAEDVVQETWLAVLEGMDRFEGRSSLKTWVFRILVNRAISRGIRERRTVPFSALAAQEVAQDEPAVDPSRFHGPGERDAGEWASPPRSWDPIPEERLLSSETLGVVERAIRGLPEAQRTVIVLRDVRGMDHREVRDILGITDGNQRVLLHRARSKVRRALERYFDEQEPAAAGGGGAT
jgi:RNA polymerase sigma-70 factor (ECF subfamily)